MINILPELIYKFRYRLSDFDIERGGSAEKCFFNALQRVRVFVDNGSGDFEPEYRSMFNMAYYLTTVIVNSDEPEQYYDEYLKRASEDFGVSLCGTGFPGEIKCMCVMLMVYWLIDTMKIVRPCERRLLNRIREWLVPEMTRVQLFVKEVPGPVLDTDRNRFAPRPLTPEMLEGTDWQLVMPLFKEDGHFNSDGFDELLLKLGKNAQEKLWIIESLEGYLKQGMPFWIPLHKYLNAVSHLNVVRTSILEPYPELQPKDNENAGEVVDVANMTKAERRKEVNKFVMSISEKFTLNKKDYRALWKGLLAINEVKAQLYSTGKQEYKVFNRNLLANIICLLKPKLLKKGVTDTDLVNLLDTEKGYGSSVREQLRSRPEDEVRAVVDKFVEEFLKQLSEADK